MKWLKLIYTKFSSVQDIVTLSLSSAWPADVSSMWSSECSETLNHLAIGWTDSKLLPSTDVRRILPASQLLHLPVLLFLQFGNKALQNRHLKLYVLCHLEQWRATAVSYVNFFVFQYHQSSILKMTCRWTLLHTYTLTS